jgi:NAD(P)H dehydrogenase (quinone)
MQMIIVTGATGKLGKDIVERLLKQLPSSEVGISVRDPSKAQDLSDRGVRVRKADFEDKNSLRHAFAGATQVLIVSSDSSGETAVTHHRNAMDAAKAVGAGRILYTSHMGSNPHSPFSPMPDHAATEALLKSSGVPFTSLRNGFYASSALQLVGRALETGKLVAPEDGKVSWTAHADLADAAVIALTDEGSVGGITPPLTGSQSLDLADIAKIASELTGQTVTRVTVPDAEWRAGLISHGVSESVADLLVGLFAASRNGEFSAVDPTLERLLGHPPMSVRDVLAGRLADGSKTFF